MKTRIVYTVIREDNDASSVEEAKVGASAVFDEPVEYLYGGRGGDEQVGVELQVSEYGLTWETVAVKAPQ